MNEGALEWEDSIGERVSPREGQLSVHVEGRDRRKMGLGWGSKDKYFHTSTNKT